jgi:hypothetical protein
MEGKHQFGSEFGESEAGAVYAPAGLASLIRVIKPRRNQAALPANGCGIPDGHFDNRLPTGAEPDER